MNLTEAQKKFIINNRDKFHNLFQDQTLALILEASHLPQGQERDNKLALAQSLRDWNKTVETLSDPARKEKDNYI